MSSQLQTCCWNNKDQYIYIYINISLNIYIYTYILYIYVYLYIYRHYHVLCMCIYKSLTRTRLQICTSDWNLQPFNERDVFLLVSWYLIFIAGFIPRPQTWPTIGSDNFAFLYFNYEQVWQKLGGAGHEAHNKLPVSDLACPISELSDWFLLRNLNTTGYYTQTALWKLGKRLNCNGPLTRYVKLRVIHAPEKTGTFSRPPTSKETVS